MIFAPSVRRNKPQLIFTHPHNASLKSCADSAMRSVNKNLKWGLPALTMHVVDAPFVIEKHGKRVEVTPIDVGHGKIMIYGYRIGNFAYLTDCKTLPEHSYERLYHLDVLLIDCLRLTPHPTHACLSETLSYIERIQPRRAVLIHMSHEVGHAELEAMLPEHIRVGYDEMEIIID